MKPDDEISLTMTVKEASQLWHYLNFSGSDQDEIRNNMTGEDGNYSSYPAKGVVNTYYFWSKVNDQLELKGIKGRVAWCDERITAGTYEVKFNEDGTINVGCQKITRE